MSQMSFNCDPQIVYMLFWSNLWFTNASGWQLRRAVRYHLKLAYHDTIVRVSWYTLGIDTSNVHVINSLHKTARTPFYVKMQFYRRSYAKDLIQINLKCDHKSSAVWLYCIIDTYDIKFWSQYQHFGMTILGSMNSIAQHYYASWYVWLFY